MRQMNKGLTIVVSAPSGGGKGTILKELFKRFKNLRYSVSATTRNPRPGEIHGEDYFFIDKDAFKNLVEEGKMLEYAEFCGNYYGTPKEPVDRMTGEGLDVVLEIEVQGGAQVKKLAPECVSIFITPPSLEVLEKRLRGRGTETEEVVLKRLETAKKELPAARSYDYVVVNDGLEKAVDDIAAILTAEKLKYARSREVIESMISG